MVEDAEEDGCKTSLYGMKVFERQFAVIKLPVDEHVFNDALDKRFDPPGRGVVQRATGCLDCICQHKYARFLCLRLWSQVTEIHLLNRIELGVFQFLCPGVKVIDDGRPVVLLDHLLDLLAKPEFVRKLDPLFHVREDDECAHVRRQSVMGILKTAPVFDVIMGHLQFADVMVVRRDPCQNGVRSYALGSGLGEVSHDDAVVVCSWGFDHHLPEQRVFQAGHFEEFYVSRKIKNVLNDGQKSQRNKAAADAADEDRNYANRQAGNGIPEKAVKHHDHECHDHRGIKARLQNDRSLLASSR